MKNVLTTTIAAAALAAVAFVPSQRGAMTLAAPAGLANAAATLGQHENVVCEWEGCWGAPYRAGYYLVPSTVGYYGYHGGPYWGGGLWPRPYLPDYWGPRPFFGYGIYRPHSPWGYGRWHWHRDWW